MPPYSNNRGINIEWVKSNHTYLLLEIFLLNSRIKRCKHVNMHGYILLLIFLNKRRENVCHYIGHYKHKKKM